MCQLGTSSGYRLRGGNTLDEHLLPLDSKGNPMSPTTAMLRRVVLTWCTTAPGGAEQSVIELGNALARRLDVTLLWWDYHDVGVRPLAQPKVTVHRVASLDGYEQALDIALADDATGTVLIGTHRTALVDIPAGMRRRIPVISVLRALLLPDGALRVVHPPFGLLPRRPAELDWTVLTAADCWVGISDAAASSITTYAPTALVRRIYNGVQASHVLRTSSPVRRFAVAARLVSYKNVDLVIHAFSALPTDLARRCQLDIYGTGPLLPELRDLAGRVSTHDRIVFHGDVRSWQAHTDVLVSACDAEGFGRIVIEAAAAGAPQIVPNRGGASELVHHRRTGLLVDLDQATALTDTLAEAASWTATEWTRHSRAAIAHARTYSISRCATSYLALAAQITTMRKDNDSCVTNLNVN